MVSLVLYSLLGNKMDNFALFQNLKLFIQLFN
jgi:hypothetical protein